MALTKVFVVALAIVGVAAAGRPTNEEHKAAKAAEAEAAAVAAAKEGKMAAVNKVVTMLADLQKQVLAEGEAEAKTYNTFACWTKTTQKDKQEAIQDGKDSKNSLTATINKLTSDRKGLDTRMAEHQKDLSEAEKAMKDATTESHKSLLKYSENKADLSSALASLNGAIKELKASKKPSLLQMQGISKTIESALVMADALGLNTAGAAAALLQVGKDVPVDMENYKFHSGSVIQTLEKLLGDFRDQKNKVDAEEVSRVSTYQGLMQEQTDVVKTKTSELNGAQKAKAKTSENIAINSQELSTISATLIDDMEYLNEVNSISQQKAKTWDQRSKVRADELSAITAALSIVKSTVSEKTSGATSRLAQMGVSVRIAESVASSADAMEAIEASAEESEGSAQKTAFLQRKHSSKPVKVALAKVAVHVVAPANAALEGREKIVELLKSKGSSLKSPLLSNLAMTVASQGTGDVFAKVKTLLNELIERLLSEAANAATHKGWCSKAMADATQKRESAASEVDNLNSDLAGSEARLDKLKENLDELTADIAKIEKGQLEATKMRGEESTENDNAVKEANAGLDAVKSAITILTQFYATAAKATVSLTQATGPKDDMPDAGFEGGEAYTGAGGVAGGVLGMLEVIEGDFVRTVKETKKAEAQAKSDHQAFMTESGKSLAEKQVASTQTVSSKGETEKKIEDDGESLRSQVSIVKTAISELMELKPACVDTSMSYADRVAKREEEVSSLKKALCILNAYASFGPSGTADAC